MTERENLSWRIKDLIFRILREEGGTDAIVESFPYGRDSALHYPEAADPLAALKLALVVRDHGAGLVRDYARKARGAGKTWGELATALGIPADTDDREHDAFVALAEGGLGSFDERYVYYKCDSCGEQIRDLGPYGGHPDDTERGHAHDCPDFTARVAAYMADF